MPEWAKKRFADMNKDTLKLFNFPEGKTLVDIILEKAPREHNFGTEKEPKLRPIYTARINYKITEFAPSLTLEKMILQKLMDSKASMLVVRKGLTINDTAYTIEDVV